MNSKIIIIYLCFICFIGLSTALDRTNIDSSLGEAVKELKNKTWMFDEFIKIVGSNIKNGRSSPKPEKPDNLILNALEQYNFENFSSGEHTIKDDGTSFDKLDSLIDLCNSLQSKAGYIFKQIDENPSLLTGIKQETIIWRIYGKSCENIKSIGSDIRDIKSKVLTLHKVKTNN